MSKYKDLTDLRFGKLLVLRETNRVNGYIRWLCKCDCGVEKSVDTSNLTSGRQVSCGCHNREMAANAQLKHGLSKTNLYKVWVWMLTRCYNPKSNRYQHYGGRGIYVCDEWRIDFMAFYGDMAAGYQKGLQLDRIDVDGPYRKDNCRWATAIENGRNKRDTIYITAFGQTKPLVQWAEDLNIKRYCLYKRYYKGKRGESLLS